MSEKWSPEEAEFLRPGETMELMDKLYTKAVSLHNNYLTKLVLKKHHLGDPLEWAMGCLVASMHLMDMAMKGHHETWFKFAMQVAARLWGPEEAVAAVLSFNEDRESAMKEWFGESEQGKDA